MAGPRTPTAVLEFKGAFKKHPERRRKGEPQPKTPIGQPPKHMTVEAKKAWREIVKQCHPGVLTGMDRLTLEVIAGGIAKLRGNPKAPASERKTIVDLLGKFGMNPADRTRISIKTEEGAGDWDDY